MDAYTRTWSAWLAGVLGSFAVLEARALRKRVADKPSGTLTATLRRWIGLDPQRSRRFLCGGFFACFCAWLAGHILLKWPPR